VTVIPLPIVRLNRLTILLAIALAGFCFGCFLFYQFKLNRARLFGSGAN
jgi:hypothetical protein